MKNSLEFVSFEIIKNEWKAMERDDAPPFLSYDYMQYIVREEKRSLCHSIRIACVRDVPSGVALMIVPLIYVRGKHTYFRMLGDTGGCEIADALFKPGLSSEIIENCVRFFLDHIKVPLVLNRLPEESLLRKTLPPDRILSDASVMYVNIPVPDTWEEYIPSLSTNARQNVRKAYRRMEKDNINYSLSLYSPAEKPLPKSVWRKMMKIYCGRRVAKYRKGVFSNETKGGPIVQSLKYLYYITIKCLWFRAKHDAFSLRKEPNTIHIVLWEGDQIMAFMSGFVTKDGKRYTVPRIAINERYQFYSPGCILLAETIRRFIDSPLHNLDLSRGDESYKFKMGGIAYYTHDIVLR